MLLLFLFQYPVGTELERWALDPGQGLSRHGGTGGGGSYTDSAEFAGPASVMDEVAKLRMVIGDDEVGVDTQRWMQLEGRVMRRGRGCTEIMVEVAKGLCMAIGAWRYRLG